MHFFKDKKYLQWGHLRGICDFAVYVSEWKDEWDVKRNNTLI